MGIIIEIIMGSILVKMELLLLWRREIVDRILSFRNMFDGRIKDDGSMIIEYCQIVESFNVLSTMLVDIH